jgi:hypothetical protein
MPSLVIRNTVERAERLLRRPVNSSEAFWKIEALEEIIRELAPAEQLALPAASRVVVSCAADQTLKLCWMQSSTLVTVTLDQLAVIPSALSGAFIRNDSTTLTSVVRVVSF